MAKDEKDGIDRRGALECMIWAGTGVLWTMAAGVPRSSSLLGISEANAQAASGFSFLQISDSHIGFKQAANPNPLGTLEEAIAKAGALAQKPAFMIHTGDITHLSRPEEFDNADQVISTAKLDTFYVPGEHDIIDENQGKAYLERYRHCWEGVQQENPSDPFTVLHDGFTNIAGDFLCFQCTLINGTTINGTAFNGGNKIFQIAWFGGTYALLPTLDLSAAYYREWQNDFSGGAKNAAGGTCALATTALASCAGTLDAVSVVLDWRFAPKWDTYIGTLYSRLNGGLDSGFLAKDNWSTTGGVRFRW